MENKSRTSLIFLSVLTLYSCGSGNSSSNFIAVPISAKWAPANELRTQTPIKHLVVIFDENVSFDKYFGTYPQATNRDGSIFTPEPNTPVPNGYLSNPLLLTDNPNLANPYLLNHNDNSFDANHSYFGEIQAYNNGQVNQFVQVNYESAAVMGYFDGNTVTAIWNYAQKFALSDNFFGATYGPTTIGSINLIAGTTGIAKTLQPTTAILNGNLISNLDPMYDGCSYNYTSGLPNGNLAEISGSKNIGDTLNSYKITWGFFADGFSPLETSGNNIKCNPAYYLHAQPFQYFASTANKKHLPPKNVQLIGSQDQANHQYDVSDFINGLNNGIFPAITYLKPSSVNSGHPGLSTPLEEQAWIVNMLNRLQQSSEWNSTAVIIAYDDSDGAYDHVYPPKSHFSNIEGRAGYGPRIPFILISPWSKVNYIDHTLLDQSSIIKFIEYNWLLPGLGDKSLDQYANNFLTMLDFNKNPTNLNPKLILNPNTGEIATSSSESR